MQTSQDSSSADARGVRWRVITTAGAQFACCVHVVGARIEVRLTKDHEGSACTRVVSTHDAATCVASNWLRAVLGNEDPTAVAGDEEVVH
jgi:hypothetical protein